MDVRKAMGNMASSLSTWGLRHLAHRPAANMPGKIALKIDPRIIAESMDKITEGSIVVVGTNGKTTITNMIADALERQGKSIACNRTGANLAYGHVAANQGHRGMGRIRIRRVVAGPHLAAGTGRLRFAVEPLPRSA